MADAACRLGDKRRAQLVYDALVPYADEFAFFGGEVSPGMPMAHWLAELASTVGDYAQARLWLDQASAICAALAADMMQQYVMLAHARLLFLSTPTATHAAPRALVRSVVAFCEPRALRWLHGCATILETECSELRKQRSTCTGTLRIVGG
jgi:hypothetical protein